VGTFYVTVEPPAGRRLPADLAVTVTAQPVSGRVPEASYPARRQPGQRPPQFLAEIPFDREERVRVRVLVRSSAGSGEAAVEVDITPPGLGPYDLLLYLFPFVALGVLWALAALRRRGPPPAQRAGGGPPIKRN
jgi:hypothetical protein